MFGKHYFAYLFLHAFADFLGLVVVVPVLGLLSLFIIALVLIVFPYMMLSVMVAISFWLFLC